MEKLAGKKIGEWEIVDAQEERNDDDYEYEEVVIDELMDHEGFTEEEKGRWSKEAFAVNVHIMFSEQTYDHVMSVAQDRLTDPRLKNLNAVVLLALKPKGRAKEGFTSLSAERYNTMVRRFYELQRDHGLGFGFDSCSAPRFENWVRSAELPDDVTRHMLMSSESCESGLFSLYVDVDCTVWPCSFCENETHEFVRPIKVLERGDFLKEVWNGPELTAWRDNVIKNRVGGSRTCTPFPEVSV